MVEELWSGIGNLKFIIGIMTKEVYFGILQINLQGLARKLVLGQRYTFQVGNDPKLTAGIIKN